MSLIARVLSLLSERDTVWPPVPPSSFVVDYYAQTLTPKGSRSRFTRRSGLTQLPASAKSETAVLAYLKRLHPGTEITIINLEYK
jgi:hypothetical protein